MGFAMLASLAKIAPSVLVPMTALERVFATTPLASVSWATLVLIVPSVPALMTAVATENVSIGPVCATAAGWARTAACAAVTVVAHGTTTATMATALATL